MSDTRLWQYYENGKDYQRQIGLDNTAKMAVDFFEGRHWKQTQTKMPKPIANIVKKIVVEKCANVLSSPVKLQYESSDNSDSATKLTEFARYIDKELRQEDINSSAIKDGCIKGTYICHYFWDSLARGLTGKIEGGLRGEVIDPLNVIFANPCEKDEQKQDWIMIVGRMQVSSVRELAEADCAEIDKITADEKENAYTEDTEPSNGEYCTVFTRYFRKGNEVYFEKGTRATMLHKARALNPTLHLNVNKESQYKAYYYPIIVGVWEERNESIYGIGEVEGIIPNQKIINFLLALHTMLAQNAGAGKYIVLPNTLKNQKITNEPAQIITDFSNTGLNGIRRLQEPPLNSSIVSFADKLYEMTRNIAGANDTISGELGVSSMSGQAIANLQQQAIKPIQAMQRRFWRCQEKRGRIFEQFFKLFYDNKEYTYEGKEGVNKGVFNGNEYIGKQFSCVVSAGAGTFYTETASIAMLDNLLSRNAIGVKTYIKLYPKNYNPNCEELLQAVNEQEEVELEQLKGKLTQYEQYLQQQQKNIKNSDNIMIENKRLKEMLMEMDRQLKGLNLEATQKIMQANDEINKQNEFIKGGGVIDL